MVPHSPLQALQLMILSLAAANEKEVLHKGHVSMGNRTSTGTWEHSGVPVDTPTPIAITKLRMFHFKTNTGQQILDEVYVSSIIFLVNPTDICMLNTNVSFEISLSSKVLKNLQLHVYTVAP